jgi:hypothetical protein
MFNDVQANRAGRTPGRLDMQAGNTLAYPSPFFDIAHTYLPMTIKHMFRWCRYYYLTNPLIAAVINKMAEYPLTDIVYDTDSKGVKNLWQNCLENDLDLRSFLIDVGIYYFCYGNAPLSLYHPTIKWLKCPNCYAWEPARKADYRFTDYKYRMTCAKCGNVGVAEVQEQPLKTTTGMRLILWNPEDIDIHFNPISSSATYYFNLPLSVRNELTIGKRQSIEEIPQIFMDAAKEGKSIVFSRDNIFHLRRPSILTGSYDRGWGTPLMMPVLKDVFYLQIMKKAQESILVERILPLTAIFPQQPTGSADPYCVSPDTLIETRDGIRRADEIREGTYLKSHMGDWKPVEYVVKRNIDDEESVYKFSIAGLKAFPFKVSEEHPILASRKEEKGKPEWIKAKDLKAGDFVCYPIKDDSYSSVSFNFTFHRDERKIKGINRNYAYAVWNSFLHMGLITNISVSEEKGTDKSTILYDINFDKKILGFISGEYAYLNINKIEKVVDVPEVYGFQVGEHKSFCVVGVATHNTTINLAAWKEYITNEISIWRLDRNYIPVMPIPIGSQVIGGDGRALLMSQEIRLWSDQIIAGMGVPNEFIWGGLSYSGSNVSLRMLENQFMRYISSLFKLISRFIIPKIAAHMEWPSIRIRFKPFKMADDLQRKAYMFQLNQSGKVSDTTLLQDSDLNPEDEDDLMKNETKRRLEALKVQQLAEAEISGEVQVVTARYQAKAQTVMAQEQQQAMSGSQGTAPGEPGEMVGAQAVNPGAAAPAATGGLEQIVQRLTALDPNSRQTIISRIGQQNPDLARQISKSLGMEYSGQTASAQPLPEQRPPRRGPESALI